MITRLQHSDIKLLRIFIEVAENQGFSAAARALNVSQSTISIQFKILEERLGLSLCRRGRSGFELTDEGHRILAAAKALEEGMQAFVSQAADVTREVYGALSIGISQVVSRDLRLAGLPEVIARLQERNPRLRVRLDVCSPVELEERVEAGEVDLAYMETGFLRRDFETIELFDMHASIYCAASHPLAGVPDAEIEESVLAQHRAVVFDINAPFSNPLNRDDSVKTVSSETSIFYIMSGKYIGYLSDSLAEPWLARGDLRRLCPERFTWNFPGGIVYRRSSLSNPIIAKAIEAIQFEKN